MATPQILQLLYSFNTFCPEFSRCLDRLIQSDGEEHYLSNLQGSDKTRLVDFLDRVRPLLFASFQFTKQILQAFGTIPVTEDISRRCLHKLPANRLICQELADPINQPGVINTSRGQAAGLLGRVALHCPSIVYSSSKSSRWFNMRLEYGNVIDKTSMTTSSKSGDRSDWCAHAHF